MTDGIGNWIHGTENNPILDIAKDVGSVLYTQTEEDNSIYDEHGSQLNQDKAMEHNKVAWSIIGDAFKLSAGTSSSIPQDESLFDFLREEVRKKDLDDTSQRLVLQMAEIWGDFIGDSIEKQSLKVRQFIHIHQNSQIDIVGSISGLRNA